MMLFFAMNPPATQLIAGRTPSCDVFNAKLLNSIRLAAFGPVLIEMPPIGLMIPPLLKNTLPTMINVPLEIEAPPPGLFVMVVRMSDNEGVPAAGGMRHPIPLRLFGALLIERS